MEFFLISLSFKLLLYSFGTFPQNVSQTLIRKKTTTKKQDGIYGCIQLSIDSINFFWQETCSYQQYSTSICHDLLQVLQMHKKKYGGPWQGSFPSLNHNFIIIIISPFLLLTYQIRHPYFQHNSPTKTSQKHCFTATETHFFCLNLHLFVQILFSQVLICVKQ